MLYSNILRILAGIISGWLATVELTHGASHLHPLDMCSEQNVDWDSIRPRNWG